MSDAPPDYARAAHDLFGLTLSPEQVSLFERYLAMLTEWNARINLTAIIEPDAVRIRHFLDSLSVVRAARVEAGMRIVDVGTGAGFPGLPLHIAMPGLETTLVEATGKKVAFLNEVIAELGLKGVRTLNARAEDAGQQTGQRATYDLVLARAVARLPALLEYLLPLAKVGGTCVAMKGGTVFDEAEDSTAALKALRGRLVDIVEVALPGVDDRHYLAVIEKTGSTPGQYPRKPGTPAKTPIMAS